MNTPSPITASELESIQRQVFAAPQTPKPITIPLTVVDEPNGYVTILDGDGAPFIHCLKTTWEVILKKYDSPAVQPANAQP